MAGGAMSFSVPVIGFVAFSGTGKTALLERLIPLLRLRGVRVALLKHAHHDFDIDQPGKDSYRLRQAGAGQVLIASRKRWALITEQEEGRPEPDLRELLAHLDTAHLDLVLVEGFKHEAYPKIELRREALGKPPLYPDDPNVIAVATDAPEHLATGRPRLDINQPEQIAEFIFGVIDSKRLRSYRGIDPAG